MTTADVADDSLLDQARRVLSTQRFGRWLGAELLARTRWVYSQKNRLCSLWLCVLCVKEQPCTASHA